MEWTHEILKPHLSIWQSAITGIEVIGDHITKIIWFMNILI